MTDAAHINGSGTLLNAEDSCTLACMPVRGKMLKVQPKSSHTKYLKACIFT